MAPRRAAQPSSAITAPSVPGITDAQRAAEALVAAGVGRVLLFGSVARSEGCERSDIDLVAIYDDLDDYSERRRRRCDLERRARDAAGRCVDVMVTDAPEWAVRTTKVPCSVEARIARYTVELADGGHHRRIDWDKKIGQPASAVAELHCRLTEMSNAIAALTDRLAPAARESAAAADGDSGELAFHADRRWMRAMGEVHMVIECAAKVAHVATLGVAAPYDHRIDVLIASQPTAVRGAFRDAARGSGIDLGDLHVWRSAAARSADLPEEHFNEAALRAHATAALRIPVHAADHSRSHYLPETAFGRHVREITALQTAVGQPLGCAWLGGRPALARSFRVRRRLADDHSRDFAVQRIVTGHGAHQWHLDPDLRDGNECIRVVALCDALAISANAGTWPKWVTEIAQRTDWVDDWLLAAASTARLAPPPRT